MSEEIGRVVKVAGPVVDVAFPQDNLPELNFALEVDITIGESKNTITLEFDLIKLQKIQFLNHSLIQRKLIVI